MRRIVLLLLALLVLLIGVLPASRAFAAPPQFLVALSHYPVPSRDMVFVEFVNPYFAPVKDIVINMVIKDSRGKMVAIGQTKMDPNMIMRPGDVTSARVPIRGRVTNRIDPMTSQYDFRIMGRQIANTDLPPAVVVQTLEVNEDVNGVPYVLGFASLDPLAPDDASVVVQYAILTFYNQRRQVTWSELMPLSAPLVQADSLMLYGKYEAAEPYDTSFVDVLFVTTSGNNQQTGIRR